VVDKLAPEDAFAVVLFTSDACVPKRMGRAGCANMEAIKAAIMVRFIK
jgi:hypothetical protein